MRRLRPLLALLLLAASCTGDADSDEITATSSTAPVATSAASDDPTDPGSRLLDTGAEPRVELRIGGDAEATISVEATYRSETTVDRATSTADFAAGYDLAANLSTSGDVVRLELDPAVHTLVGLVEPDEIGALVWRLDASGDLQAIDGAEARTDLDPDLGDLLSTPALVIPVPTEPVGVGAQWSFLLGGGERLGVVTLASLADTEFTVTIELLSESDEGSFSMTGGGMYDRTSLIATDARYEIVVGYTADVVANGVATTLDGTRWASRSYREAGR